MRIPWGCGYHQIISLASHTCFMLPRHRVCLGVYRRVCYAVCWPRRGMARGVLALDWFTFGYMLEHAREDTSLALQAQTIA